MPTSNQPAVGCSVPYWKNTGGVASPLLNLSSELRVTTASLHAGIEQKLRVPAAFRSLTDYREFLLSLYRFYRPLEVRLMSFTDWHAEGVRLFAVSPSQRLASDLSEMGVALPDFADAPVASLPELTSFPQALGALYVIEGQSLGNQVILHDLQRKFGDKANRSIAFLRGDGPETGSRWNLFKATLDAFGARYPEARPAVVAGARATFQAFGGWLRPAEFDSAPSRQAHATSRTAR
jgi:heme oxygenase